MTNELKVWSAPFVGADGHLYHVRMLLTDEELAGLQSTRVVSPLAMQVIGMQTAADELCARLELEALRMNGGTLQ